MWSAAAVACLLGCGTASAQSIFGGGGANARAQAAYSDWRRLSQNEIDCVIDTLRERRSSLQAVIQRGIGPNDAAMAPVRAACRNGARPAGTSTATNQQRSAPNAAQALAAVDSRADEAARKVAAERRAAELAAEKALAEKVAAEVAAVRKAAAQKAAEEKAAADRIAAEQAAAQKAAEEKAAADNKKAADEIAARKAQAEKSAAVAAKPEQPVQETAQQQPQQDEQTHQDTPRISAEAANALAQARLSFLYGLFSGPLIFCLGGAVFMLIGRRRSAPVDPFDPFGELKPVGQTKTAAADHAARGDRAELDGMVRAVLAELERRKGRPADPLASAPRASRIEETGLH